MSRGTSDMGKLVDRGDESNSWQPPTPTARFRRRAWLAFQRALDPLASPRPLPTQKRLH
jgi:hypothetical protein